jgi:two-component system cell cycle response regulator
MEKERLSILVIDPQTEDHILVQDSFEKSDVPAALRFVNSSEEALATLEKSSFDLILTDHVLPHANAFHFLFEIRQRGLSLPVLLLTRNGEARVAREAFHRGADDFLLKQDLETVSLLEVIGNLIEKRRQRDERAREELLLRDQAERDALTGLYNRRYFAEALEKEFARARRYRRDLSLVMIDLDGFKAINDACGHPQGDRVLQQVSRLLMQGVRFVDVVTRYGGDEFAVLLPETNLKTASRIAGRILKEIRKSPFLHENKIYSLSASIGVAALRPGHASSQALFKETDEALYQAKREGRDRIATGRRSPSEGSDSISRPHR